MVIMGTDQLLKWWLWKLNILVKWWLWELTNYCTGDYWFIVESGGEAVIIETKYTGEVVMMESGGNEVAIMGTNYSD